MKNMGLSRLRITGTPREDLDEGPLLARAVHGTDIWKTAAFFGSLEEAAGDCSLLVGTTRRRGRHRKSLTMNPRELAAWFRNRSGGPAGLVFGNERTGLEDEELALCSFASHIPVSGEFPSLNLSHAVQIYAYELFLALGEDPGADPVKGAWAPLKQQEADVLSASITDTLAKLGFYRHSGREEQKRFLRDLISRAGLGEREGKYLADIFIKAGRLGSRADKAP
jgi:tRNA/rRNA methyltransferase/tRNA (cytidine32/uridine32-2'-O)-methyltransferase